MKTLPLIDTIVTDIAALLVEENHNIYTDATIDKIKDAITGVLTPPSLTDAGRQLFTDIVGLPHAGVLLDTTADHIRLLIPAYTPADSTGIFENAIEQPPMAVAIEWNDYSLTGVRALAHAVNGLWIRHSFAKTIDEGKMTIHERDNLHAYKLISEALPVLAGQAVKKQTTSSTITASDTELNTIGIDRDELHYAEWTKYGKTREKPVLKLVFKALDSDLVAKKAIVRKLASFIALDDNFTPLAITKSASSATDGCIVAYVDIYIE